MAAPDKATQEAESATRTEATARAAQAARIDPAAAVAAAASDAVNLTGAVDVVDDGARGDPGTAQPQPQQAEQRPLPPVGSKYLDKRAEIVARFTTDRTAAANAERDEISDFARHGGVPPEWNGLDAQPQPASIEASPDSSPDSAPAAVPDETPPASHKYKVKVHGVEQELTAEELIAKAQIALASENILDEVKELRRQQQLQNSAQPAGQPRQPAAQNAGTETDPDGQPSDQAPAPNQEQDKVRKLIEAIQFGDPGEAESLLQNTIAEITGATVQQVLQAQRLKDEGARSGQVLADFKRDHPEIAADPMAEAAIQYKVFEHQLKDLRDLGVDPNQIQTSHGGPPNPGDIAMAHRWYRTEGYKVRTPHELLTTATTEFVTWKGVKTEDATPAAPASNKAAPRIEVDRTARRQAIPQQPSQIVAPRVPAAVPVAPQPRDRSEIVASIRQQRGALRGQVIPR